MRRLSEEKINKIIELKNQGKSYKEIAEIVNVCYDTVVFYCNPEARKKRYESIRNYLRRKLKLDPEWNAKKQREFRAKHPDKYCMIMARHYLKKLTPEQIKEVLKDVLNKEIEI